MSRRKEYGNFIANRRKDPGDNNGEDKYVKKEEDKQISKVSILSSDKKLNFICS